MRDRVRHVAQECERVRRAAVAMKSGDMAELGKLLTASHASLRDLYEVTGKELDALAAAAQAHSGCLGARMTGAGFGGCTISLVHKDAVRDFIRFVGAKYEAAIGYKATFYEKGCEISDGIVVEAL